MNYDHSFHAGNFADVVKHIILVRILTYLQRKPKPFRVIDTHGGSGIYDLTSSEAERSPEWREGIQRLMKAELPDSVSELVAPYLDAVRTLNPSGPLQIYPGSPKLVRQLLRDQDRLTAMDLHPTAALSLKDLFDGDQHTKIMQLDGYAALPAQLPPKEKRGLVLIDPPFEQRDEFDRLPGLLAKAHRHFATGIYAIWYPLKDVSATERFKSALKGTDIPGILATELSLRAPSLPPRLYGTGMIIVNPPYVLEAELKAILSTLVPLLSDARSANYSLEWLTPAP